ncbi:HUS1-like [Octopus vulgaris]|uniref:HUS1-like n=2 Tax=Octopus TaxID=6643 RepID=A0AA36B4L8_OCTVU|nr:checkpoint protein HUS1-like [Octopus sinensis]CAI9727833.1 HUS1-like [Octopus vulgaris]
MRFRAKLVDIGSIQHFTRIIATITRLCKTCVLRITLEKFYFIILEKALHGGAKVWCELFQDHFFDEYMLDGLSKDNDEIFLEINPDNLLKALKTGQTAKWIKIKLTKKQVPSLTLEVDLPTVTGLSRTVVHDIPVSVLALRHWADYDEPDVPDFDVSINMPALKLLRNVVDKMKSISNFVIVSANCDGKMKLMVETDVASVCTYFRDLTNPKWKDKNSDLIQSSSKDPSEFSEVRVDLRKFAQFLNGLQLNPSRVICNFSEDQMIHILLLHDDVTLQYFMPAVSV